MIPAFPRLKLEESLQFKVYPRLHSETHVKNKKPQIQGDPWRWKMGK